MAMRLVQVPVRIPEDLAYRFRVALVYSRETAQEVLEKAVTDYILRFEAEDVKDRKFGKVG